MNIFGFEINYKKKKDQMQSVVTPTAEDGSTVMSSSAAAYYTQVVDMETSLKNENDLIRRYREIAIMPECDAAIEEIVNEAICVDDSGEVAKLNLEDLKVSDTIKKKIQEEFQNIKYAFDFDDKAHDYFKHWYIDGRQYFIIALDSENTKAGIQKIDFVDSRKIRKVKKVQKTKDPKTGVEVVSSVEEFFIYNEKGIGATTTQGIKLSVDSVIYCPSGLYDTNSNAMFSYLHKAIKPVNQLRMLEDATVVYRLARAPERRIFYIDVGNLPKVKAEQYVTDIMNKYKNKIVYDASTGEVRDDRKFMSMLEDYWMPRREGGKGTEITTLPGGQTLGQMEDVEYFERKVYQTLNVPVARLQPDNNFSLGRSTEITRDELKFSKFVSKLRNKYSQVLIDLLKVQLIAKNIVNPDDWEEVQKNISIEFAIDNNFVELRDAELWNNRVALLQQMDQYVGRYFSDSWIKQHVLKLSEEDIKEMDKEIEAMPEPEDEEDNGYDPNNEFEQFGQTAGPQSNTVQKQDKPKNEANEEQPTGLKLYHIGDDKKEAWSLHNSAKDAHKAASEYNKNGRKVTGHAVMYGKREGEKQSWK